MPPASSMPPLSQPTVTEPATNVNHGELTDHSLLDLPGQSALHAHQAQDSGRHRRRKRGQKAESQRCRRQLRRRVKREKRRAREDEIKALNVAIQLGQVNSISDHIGEHDWTSQDSSLGAATPIAGASTWTSKDKGKKRKMEVETLPTFPASLDTSSGSSSSPGHQIVMPRKKSKHMEAAASSSNPLSLDDDTSSADWKSANMESSTQAESSTTAKHLKGDVMQKQFRRAFHPVSMIAGTIEECLFRSTKMTKQENKTIAQAINNNVNYMNDVRMFGFMALHLLIMSEVGHVTQDTQDDEFSTDGEDDQQHLHPLNLLLHTVHGFTIIRHILKFVMDGKLTARGRQPKLENKDTNDRCRRLAEKAYDLLTQKPPSETGEQVQKSRIILPFTTKAHASSLAHTKDQIASDMMIVVRQHYKKLPDTIQGRVSRKKCSNT